MRNKFGIICMILGAVLVLAALSLSVHNQREAQKAEASVEEILPKLQTEIGNSSSNAPQGDETDASGEADLSDRTDLSEKPEAQEESEDSQESDTPEEPGNQRKQDDSVDPAMKEVEIDGYRYIGYLSIPSLGLELPVMTVWNYSCLQIAPCRYSGSVKTDNLVIAAHNYASHFGNLTRLSQGDTVLFTDMDKKVYEYQVAEVVTLNPTAIEEMTAGEYALTLFTCTYSGQSRVTVHCEPVKKEAGK